MPDLSIVYVQMCSDLDPHKHWTIGGYQQYLHVGEIACTCKGYHFRKTCKHVKQLQEEQCTWHGLFDELQTEEQEENHTCPRCGKKTVTVRCGV